jgi:hypothetical protein
MKQPIARIFKLRSIVDIVSEEAFKEATSMGTHSLTHSLTYLLAYLLTHSISSKYYFCR